MQRSKVSIKLRCRPERRGPKRIFVWGGESKDLAVCLCKIYALESCLTMLQHTSLALPSLTPSSRPSSVTAILSGVEEPLRHGLHLLRCHLVDARNDLVHGEELVEVHLLPRQVGHARVRALQTHQNVALQLVLGARQLFRASGVSFRLRNSARIRSTTSSALPADVPA